MKILSNPTDKPQEFNLSEPLAKMICDKIVNQAEGHCLFTLSKEDGEAFTCVWSPRGFEGPSQGTVIERISVNIKPCAKVSSIFIELKTEIVKQLSKIGQGWRNYTVTMN